MVQRLKCLMHVCLGTFLSPTAFVGVVGETDRLIVMFRVVFLESVSLGTCQTERVLFGSGFGLRL